jgi:hypothetical protein
MKDIIKKNLATNMSSFLKQYDYELSEQRVKSLVDRAQEYLEEKDVRALYSHILKLAEQAKIHRH